MKRIIAKIAFSLLLAGASIGVNAASSGVHLDEPDNTLVNTASLQRGAKYFVNYCLGCHSLKYVRYQSLIDDLGITEQQLMENLMFTAEKPTEMMTTPMDAVDSERWFGVTPPDLSLTARARGTAWIYTYLRSFYLDDSRPIGVNNTVLPNASMPHVLAPLQGYQRAVFKETVDADGNHHEEFVRFDPPVGGAIEPQEYDEVVRDIVNFLEYVSEPVKLKRQAVGMGVLAFLLVFFLFAYFLKREFWKDIH
ncbi:MAG: cytochrome c1 [Proteobacteria bacterium]|nr:cytochrome c1 [Pseudomonadota bacterium]